MTINAVTQVDEVVTYIGNVLMEPDTAIRWKNYLQAQFAKLSDMPGRVQLTNLEPWRSAGIHQYVVQNFTAYFWIDEEHGIVWITAVVYQRRDQLSALLQMPMN